MQRYLRLRYVVVGFLLFVLAGALAAPALAQTPAFITNASRVNMRTGPGAGFPVVAILARGQQVTLIGSNADSSWLQLRLVSGAAGWVNARYVGLYDQGGGVPITQPTGRLNAVVSTPLLNVRTGPGANFAIVAKLPRGTAMNLIGRNADSSWLQMSIPGGAAGWVSSRYVSASVYIPGLPVTSDTGTTPGFPPPVSGGGQTGVVTASGLNVRYGPGVNFGLFERVRGGETVSLVGRNAAGNWLLVQLANGLSGWVNAGFVRTSYPIASLPIRG
jgi:uncharacterized protein YraI